MSQPLRINALPPSLSAMVPSRYRLQLLLFIGTFAGGWAAIFGRIAQHEGISTPVIITFRLILGALIVTPFVIRNYRSSLRQLNKSDLVMMIVAGFLLSMHLLAGFAALEHTSVLISNVIGSTLTIWVALMEVYLLGVQLGRFVWIALGVTLIGGLIIALTGNNQSLGDNPSLGNLLALMAALAGAAYAISGRQSRSKIPFLVYVWLLFGFGGIFSLVVVAITHGSFVGHTANGYLAIIMLTLSAQLVGHSIYNYVLRRLPATLVSVSSQIGTVISAVLAFLLLKEIPGAWQLLGSAIIIGGITLVNFKKNAA
ncbi:MAG: DMT family transporter [Anaerolineae bacterium]